MEEMTQEEMAAIEELKELKAKSGKTKPYENSWTAEEAEQTPLLDLSPLLPDLTPEQLEEMEKIKEEQAAQVERERERVKEQYGIDNDKEISRILLREKEQKECEDCLGLPCKKRQNKCVQIFICPYTVKGVTWAKIEYLNCKYEVMHQKQTAIQRKFGLSRIPTEYLGKTFDDYNVDSNNAYAVEVAKKLIEYPDKGAYFFGNVGTGKTFLAAIIAQEVMKQGRQVFFATVPTISTKIRSTFNTKEKLTEGDILEKLYTVPTLILDDIGIEKPTRFVCSTLCNIFNERYNARLQTIMTSNYPLKALENIFNNPTDEKEPTFDGSRIYDRCKQMCIPIELKGNSRR